MLKHWSTLPKEIVELLGGVHKMKGQGTLWYGLAGTVVFIWKLDCMILEVFPDLFLNTVGLNAFRWLHSAASCEKRKPDWSSTFEGYPKLCRQLRHAAPCTVAQKTVGSRMSWLKPRWKPTFVSTVRTVRINIWQGKAAHLRAVARMELHVWSVLCSHWVAAVTL